MSSAAYTLFIAAQERADLLYYAGLEDPVECPRCEGAGMWMECYGGPPSEVRCDYCDGMAFVSYYDAEDY
jgi:hypothetical protein